MPEWHRRAISCYHERCVYEGQSLKIRGENADIQSLYAIQRLIDCAIGLLILVSPPDATFE